jgi:c(7)-type cytochrome triheme protein
MRYLLVFVTACFLSGAGALAQEKKPPAKLTFTAKPGNVNYDHAAHVKRANNDCKTCHDKLFPQSATAPLNYKPAMHKTAETNHTSCGSCHRPGGTAFETKGNCAKCHTKAG